MLKTHSKPVYFKDKMTNILFLCSKNKLRSPTAEAVFSNYDGWNVYSAGISNDAEVHVASDDIKWADYIFVMEKNHLKKLRQTFSHLLKEQRLICLNIPDNYKYMDSELINILKQKVIPFVKL
jgi:predicted protein tyrosine phosphatase